MKVTLLAYTQLNSEIVTNFDFEVIEKWEDATDGQIVSLSAIRQCYSHKTALEVLETESEKYFGEKGKEAKRLFKQIVTSKHTSTLEHLNFTFAIEGVSRSLLAQLTRHRHMSFNVQEDTRAVLPNAATCNLVLTANLRTLLEFYEKRKHGSGAQKEISKLAEELKNRVIEVEPWTSEFFEG